MNNANIHLYVVDAGSTDGTLDAVRRLLPRAHLIDAGSDVFWNRGMRMAQHAATETGHDFYLWLNDDTVLHPDALARLIETHDSHASMETPTIIVGTTADRESGAPTYGGLVHAGGMNPVSYRMLPPGESAQPCETMNGNCVLIPHAAYLRVGHLDPRFSHSAGDVDYGLRARRQGCAIWIAAGIIGTCSRNAVDRTWRDTALPRRVRWQKVCGPKGLPPAEWLHFTRRHAGLMWPLVWISPYLRIALGR
jgi:GT2 family glycosyltransferase